MLHRNPPLPLLVLCRNPPLPREPARAISTTISRSCSCLRTSIFAHRSADRSNASANLKAPLQGIVSPVLVAHQLEAETQYMPRKRPTEFASSSHLELCDVPRKGGLTDRNLPPNFGHNGSIFWLRFVQPEPAGTLYCSSGNQAGLGLALPRFRRYLRDSVISNNAGETIFTPPRSPPETEASYDPVQANNGVRSCWYQF